MENKERGLYIVEFGFINLAKRKGEKKTLL
jgi:hypothetical protein